MVVGLMGRGQGANQKPSCSSSPKLILSSRQRGNVPKGSGNSEEKEEDELSAIEMETIRNRQGARSQHQPPSNTISLFFFRRKSLLVWCEEVLDSH